MKYVNCPITGEHGWTVDNLLEWEEVFERLGARKQPFGYYTAAAWMHKNGLRYEYSAADYRDESMHSGELLGLCAFVASDIARTRGLPFIAGFATTGDSVFVPHCWNLNDEGRVLDLTWHCHPYDEVTERQYIGRQMRNFSDEHATVFDVLYPTQTQAALYYTQFEYVNTQTWDSAYIVKDWYNDIDDMFPCPSKLLPHAEFKNQLTCRQKMDARLRKRAKARLPLIAGDLTSIINCVPR